MKTMSGAAGSRVPIGSRPNGSQQRPDSRKLPQDKSLERCGRPKFVDQQLRFDFGFGPGEHRPDMSQLDFRFPAIFRVELFLSLAHERKERIADIRVVCVVGGHACDFTPPYNAQETRRLGEMDPPQAQRGEL